MKGVHAVFGCVRPSVRECSLQARLEPTVAAD